MAMGNELFNGHCSKIIMSATHSKKRVMDCLVLMLRLKVMPLQIINTQYDNECKK